VQDLPNAVQQIAKFVGKDLSQEVTQKIANQTTFKAMSDNQDRYFRKEMLRPGAKFIRKGEVDDWKNYFTEEQNEIFEELSKKKMTQQWY